MAPRPLQLRPEVQEHPHLRPIWEFLNHRIYVAEVSPASRTLSDFHFLISSRSIEHIKAFIDEKSCLLSSNSINFITDKNPESGMTALHLAIKENSLEIVKLLMAHGADVYRRDKDGLIPAHLALILRHKPILELILRESAVNPVDRRGFTHLHAAALLDDPRYLRKYLEISDEVNARMTSAAIGNENGENGAEHETLNVWPVRAKNYWRETEAVDTRRCHQRAFRGYAPLHFAVEHENLETLELLFTHSELEIDLRDARGYSALHLACALTKEKHAMTIVKMLLSGGADVAAHTDSGATPLIVATHLGHKNIVALLLQHGAEANVQEEWEGITPLHLASRYLMVDIVLMLLAAGADAKRSDTKKRTPLHWMILRDWCYGMHSALAIERDQDKCCAMYDTIIEALITRGCDIDSRDKYGHTAMVAAAMCHNSCAARRLHLWEPNLQIRDNTKKIFEDYDKSKIMWCGTCYSIHPALNAEEPTESAR